MKSVNIVKVSDIGDLRLEQYSTGSNSLFITATRSLNYQTKKNNNLEILDFTQLDNYIRAKLKDENCLTESEMRYLLYRTISQVSNEVKKQSYRNSASLIYELFNNLLMANVTENDIDIRQIKKTKLSSYADIFQLYIDYEKNILKQEKKSYQAKYNDCLVDYLKGYENVSLVGFSFFNDIQTFIVKTLIGNDKLGSLITNDDFVINDLFEPILKHFNVEYTIQREEDKQISKFDSLRQNIFNRNKVEQDISEGIKFYRPFVTREDEFKFVISQIVAELKDCKSKQEIEKKCEKIAVIIVSQFAKQTQLFNDLLKRQGVFVAP